MYTLTDKNEVFIELDETAFDFGTAYEMEIETAYPEKVKLEIEKFLREHEIEFSESKNNKYVNFRKGSLD